MSIARRAGVDELLLKTGSNETKALIGTADPSVAPGVAAPLSSTLQQAGAGELWLKTGAADTDWTRIAPTTAAQRLYDAVVDAAGGGDFTSIVDAFNAGNERVFVRAGVYAEVADIVVPTKGCLIGEAPGAVAIDLSAGDFAVSFDGTGRQTSTGTIEIGSATDLVTGTGTAFDVDLQDGDYIRLGTTWHKIETVNSATSLTLEQPYQGPSIPAGTTYVAQSMHVGGCLENLMILNSVGTGLELLQVFHAIARSVLVRGCVSGGAVASFRIVDSAECAFFGMLTEASGQIGVELSGSSSLLFNGSTANNNNGIGFLATDCDDLIYDTAIATQNDGDGFAFTGTTSAALVADSVSAQNTGKGVDSGNSTKDVNVIGCVVHDNALDGIDFDGRTSVVANCEVFNNGGSGVFGGENGVLDGCHIHDNGGDGVSGANDVEVTMTGCICRDNGGRGIAAGVDNAVSGCVVTGNVSDGIDVGNNNACVITGSRVSGNGGDGVTIGAGANNVVVVGNNLQGNTGASLNDAGTATVATGNAV